MKKETAQTLLQLSQTEYDRYASEFSNSRQFFWEELSFLKKYALAEDQVLDIGCGNGRLSDLFRDKNIRYTGLDFSKKLIEIAQKERRDNGTFIQADALSLPFQDNFFDTAFSVAELDHIPSKENRLQFISEAHRVLKPGGVCIVTIWNTLQWRFAKAHLTHSLKKLSGRSRFDFGDIILPFGKHKRKRYLHSFTKNGLRKLFVKNNFVDISVDNIKRKSGHANLVVIAKKPKALTN